MLLFQVGDFYEFFGDDARRASHVCVIAIGLWTLTKTWILETDCRWRRTCSC